jgi:hypothetical protein
MRKSWLLGLAAAAAVPHLAHAAGPAAGPADAREITKLIPHCTATATTLCLDNTGYKVSATFKTPDGTTGPAQAVGLTDDTGYFWFFSSDNVEVVLKVIDGCALNGNVWVFAGGLTNVQVTITVVQVFGGAMRQYVNPLNTAFLPIQDTSAFPCPQISTVRAKQDITEMGDASAGLMKLRPVTFHYRPEFDDGAHNLQYGLIAEEVAKVYPNLVEKDKDGKPLLVRYHLMNAMLLNEVQKQRREAERQRDEIEELRRQIATVRQRLEALGAKPSPQ